MCKLLDEYYAASIPTFSMASPLAVVGHQLHVGGNEFRKAFRVHRAGAAFGTNSWMVSFVRNFLSNFKYAI